MARACLRTVATPYFPGWPDTIQLNYGNPDLQEAMIGELLRIARQCDGLRCDMAMLILPEVFRRTWSIESQPFWPRAISRVREDLPDFVFLAEVYWDLEWTLQQQGFDYCYDKRLYDRLREGNVRSVRDHLSANLDFQNRLARFLENHDEPRAAATFEPTKHRAAAIVTYFSPGLRFFHQGQFEGYRQRVSPHLVRGPLEPVNAALAEFYSRLLAALRHPPATNGTWQLMQCLPASEGNWTYDCFIAHFWEYAPAERLAVAVNFSDHQSQARLRLPFATPDDEIHCFKDLLDDTIYERKGSELTTNGLYLDLPAWGVHIFSVSVSGLPPLFGLAAEFSG